MLQNLGVSGEELISKYLKQTLALPFHKKARFPALSTLVKCGGIFFEYPQFLIIFRDKTKNDRMGGGFECNPFVNSARMALRIRISL